MEAYFGANTPKLGFGLMRLPKDKKGNIDLEQVKEMVDQFMAAGQTYFDTAYVYDDGGSERAAKAALVDRYPRESYTLATKLCAWMGAHDEKSAKQQFTTSLERTGAGYFDYYLLHALQAGNYKTYDKYHLWDFVREQKEKGLIKHWGFSFHATPEILDEVLTAHPDSEFVQLQLNYADWENPAVTARATMRWPGSTASPSWSWSPSRAAPWPTPFPQSRTSSGRWIPTPPLPPGPSGMPPPWTALSPSSPGCPT